MKRAMCIWFPAFPALLPPNLNLCSSLNPRHRNAIRLVIWIFLSLTVAAISLSQAAFGNDPQNTRSQNRGAAVYSNDVVPGIVVVKLKHSNSISDGPVARGADPLLSAFSDRGVTSLARAFPLALPLRDADVAAGKVDLSQIHFGTIPASMNPVEVAARLADLPQVEYAEPKYYSYLCDVPNDSDYAAMQQVYFDRMNVPAGWTLQKGGTDIVIATVDGGTFWRHTDLQENIWINPAEDLNHDGIFQQFPAPAGDLNGIDDDNNGYVDDVVGWNFTNSRNDPRGSLPGNANHGTKTASLFGAVTNNNRGMAGTSWNCRIMAVCAADPKIDNRVLYGFKGIQYAAAMGACVINCSWGRPGGTGTFSQMEQDVITAATEAGALIVAAAGNYKHNIDDIPYYPAAYDHVLSVGATLDTSDAITDFTDYGLNVSVFAPGVNIRVALNNGSYGTDQGTSDASPLVAGLAGLLKAAHPGWAPEQIAQQIRMTADPIDGSNPSFAGSLAHGRVNFYRALSEVHSGTVIIARSFHKPSDTTTTFMTGDTVIFSVKLKNVLTIAAENLSFSVTADPGLILLPPILAPTRLDGGAEDSLGIAFRVGDLARGQDVFVRLSWSANADEWDARMLKTTVYARTGIWKRQTSPTAYKLYSVHAVSSSVAWAAGTRGDGKSPVVLKTTDGGDNWAIVSGAYPGFAAVSVFAIDSLHAWVSGNGGHIFATLDGGSSWTQQNYPPPQSGYVIRGFWFFDAAYGYALGDTGTSGRFVLLRTTDGGATWTHLANEPAGDGNLFTAANLICCTDRQHVWFGGPNSLVYRTTDGGDIWSTAAVGTGPVTALAMHDDSVGIACTWGEPPSFARTTDGGATWQTLSAVKPDRAWAAAFPFGSKAWVAGLSTVACSPDHGASWVLERTEPFSGNLIAISFSDSANGWIVTDLGEILRYHDCSDGTVVWVRPEGKLPVQTLLLQNYPNPFNPTTVISYQLPAVSKVELAVYDVLGRKVSTLVNEVEGPGAYTVEFDATDLASGVYFYQLKARDFVQTRKLLVLK